MRPDPPAPAALAEPWQAPLAVYAALLDADDAQAGARRLAVALAAQGGYDCVAVGRFESGRLRLIGHSQLELAQLPAALSALLEGAMQEAVEQGVSLAWPASEEATVRVVEQELLQRELGGAVASVPLGAAGQPHGAVCVQRHTASPFSAAELRRLETLLMLAAPALRWQQLGTETWYRRAGRDLARQATALRRPQRRWALAAALVLAALLLVPLEDGVGGRARIEGAEQRVVAAPTDGFVKTAHVRPGDRVKAGAPLVDLLESDLRLERERGASQLAQHENAYAAAMAKSDRVGAATSMARVGEAQAQLALVDEQLARGRLTAPFDALVIQGDLSQSIGAPVRQGDVLLTLATSGRQRVIVEVDEVDIARVAPGQRGRLALSALPWESDELVVERIAPLARAVDGRNVFEVEARLLAAREGLRPGLLGRAELLTGRAPLLWSWSRHALLRLRVALWAWLA